MEEFVKDKQHWDSIWPSDTEQFKTFIPKIKGFYHDWKEAEDASNVAKTFDKLIVFQQILNIFQELINYLSILDRNTIYSHFTNILYHFKELEAVKNESELMKISFDPSSGFSIMNLNLFNGNKVAIEKQIKLLFKTIIRVIKLELGFDEFVLNYIHNGLFKYFFSNYFLIKKLDLDVFLLKLLLT